MNKQQMIWMSPTIRNFVWFVIVFLNSIGKSTAQDCYYEAYNLWVKEARQSASSNDYKHAEQYLQKAFSNIEFPKGEDLAWALQLAFQRKKEVRAKKLAIQLAKGGVPLRHFRRYKNSNWYVEFEKDFQNYIAYYEAHFNSELKREFLALLKKDVAFNEKYHSWRTHEIEMTLQELTDGANEIHSDFSKMISEFGFPFEHVIGYHYDYPKNRVESYPVEVLLIHLYQRGSRVLEEEIPELICKGGLNPAYNKDSFARIQGFGDGTGIEQEMKARYLKFRNE